MGISFSSNSIQDYVDEQNNAITSSIQNSVTNNTNICSSIESDRVSFGCCDLSYDANGKPIYTNCVPAKIIGGSEVTIDYTSNLNCQFTNQNNSNLAQAAQNNLANSANLQASQINKTIQEALSMSISDSENDTTFAQNLINNMITTNIQNINQNCSNKIFISQNSNLSLCIDVEQNSKLDYNNASSGKLIANCISNAVSNNQSFNKSMNNVINQISQYNSTKQEGLLGCLVAFVVVLILIIGTGLVSSNKNVQQSNTKYLFYGLILFFVIILITSIALGIYFWNSPAETTIDPIVINDKNDTITFQIINPNDPTNVKGPLSAGIQRATYGQGDALATAIQNSMNAALFPDNNSLDALSKALTKVAGSDAINAQNFVVDFEPDSKQFEFSLLYGNSTTNSSDAPRYNYKLINGSNNILDSIGGSKLYNTVWTATNNAKTDPVAFTPVKGFWFYFWIIFGILAGIFLIIGLIGIFLSYRKKTTTGGGDSQSKK